MKLKKRLSPSRKNQSFSTLYDRILIFGLFLFIFYFLVVPVIASASTLSEEFSSETELKTGSLVSLKKDSPKQVELSSIDKNQYLLGVVTESDNSSVNYVKQSSQVSVALSGEVKVFVTDANGVISKGDFIGASWLEGVGMKSNTDEKQKLLGVALEDYDSSNSNQYGEIDTPEGKKNVTVNFLNVRLFERDNSEEVVTKSNGIEGLLSKIAGKDVSLAKIIFCLLVFLVSILVSGFFVSSSIKGSFISIGRNPLASPSIYRSLIHVTSISVVIILIGTALSYVVLAA